MASHKITKSAQHLAAVSFAPIKSVGWGWWKKLLLRLGFYVSAIAILSWSARGHRYALTTVLAVLVAVLGLFVHRSLAKTDVSTGSLAVKLLVWGLTVEIGFVICAVQDWHVFGYLGFLGLSLVAFGIGQLSAEIRATTSICGTVALVLWVNCLAALVAVAALGVGGWPVLIGGMVALYPAISFGTEFVLNTFDKRWASHQQRHVVVAVAGLLAIALGVVRIKDIGGLRLAVLVAVVILIAAGLIASNTDADMLFVLFAFAVIWSQLPRGDVAAPAFNDATGAHSMLVIGDSYISGEGARAYLSGTNTDVPSRADQCRRSQAAWAIQVAASSGLSLDFLACSGAKAENIFDVGQYVGENPDDQYAVAPDGSTDEYLWSQVGLYDLLDRKATLDWVFVSIGGNDAGFGDLVQACLLPGDCSLGGQARLDRLRNELEPKLDDVYAKLFERFGDRVVVVPYPVPIREKGCDIFDSTFTDREHLFLHGFTDQMDSILQVQAAKHGLRFVSDMRDLFMDDVVRICDTDAPNAGVNYVALNPVGGDIDPTTWVHNSMHPNENGQNLMATLMQTWMAAPTVPQAPVSVVAPALSLTAIMNDGRIYCATGENVDGCVAADEASSFDNAQQSVRHHLVALLLLALGSWAVWLSILNRRRTVRTTALDSRWTIGRWLDERSMLCRGAVAVIGLAFIAAFMLSLGWLAGLLGGYGAAQSNSAARLLARPATQWATLYAQSWRDLMFYVPLYVAAGLAIIVVVRPTRRSRFRSKWLDQRLHALPRVSSVAALSLVITGIADLVETSLFRASLGRLRNSAGRAQIDTLTTCTQLMTATKYIAGLVALGLLCWSIVARGQATDGGTNKD